MTAGSSYTWYARTAPMLLALVPLGVGVAVWFPETTWERISAIVLAPAVLAIVLGEKGRDRGRRLQTALWSSWGGPLITQYLRHRDATINKLLKGEYHKKLAWLLPNITIPSEADEADDPASADQVYDACAQHIVVVVRDPKRFPLVFKENRSYGFRRNVWGIKPLGIAFSLAGLAAALIWASLHRADLEFLVLDRTISSLVCATLVVFWVFLVTRSWVRIPNDAYARRTLEGIPQMEERDRLGG